MSPCETGRDCGVGGDFCLGYSGGSGNAEVVERSVAFLDEMLAIYDGTKDKLGGVMCSSFERRFRKHVDAHGALFEALKRRQAAGVTFERSDSQLERRHNALGALIYAGTACTGDEDFDAAMEGLSGVPM